LAAMPGRSTLLRARPIKASAISQENTVCLARRGMKRASYQP
jgi:hypothetical protein